MLDRIRFVWIALVIAIALVGCVSDTQEPPTSTPVPKTSTPVPPTATSPPPTSTLALPTARPTVELFPITTYEDLVGVWHSTRFDADVFLSFREDGRVMIGGSPTSGDVIEIWFEDGLLHAREDSDFCSDNQIGIYEMQGASGDQLVFTIVTEPCDDRGFVGKWRAVSD